MHFPLPFVFFQRINATELTFTYIFNDEIFLVVTETIRTHIHFIERVDVNNNKKMKRRRRRRLELEGKKENRPNSNILKK